MMRRHSLDSPEVALNPEEPNAPPSDELMDLDLDMPMPPTEDDVLQQNPLTLSRPSNRFYRPSQARRKDSAASSRRNSMSSVHSRCSSIQSQAHHDGAQSKHIAQHLRRASFLEDRRARLADRAAHAEKVRLRAALAKAAPRGSVASEERALAAQQAKERILAEIVANCSEEVRKAKQRAEQIKEKREQDSARIKAQIEERMAEAGRRREELRIKNTPKRGRGQSGTGRKPSESSPPANDRVRTPLTHDEATARLAGWLSGCIRRNAIQQFNSLGLTVDGIRDTSFDSVVDLLALPRVLTISARLFRICGLHEGEPASVEEMAAVRTFLSAYLILGHPSQVLSNRNDMNEEDADSTLATHRLPSTDLSNPQLQDLIGKAKDLLVTFETILSRLTPSNRFTMPPGLQNTLSEAYAVFYNAFIAWKSRDSNALIEVMLMQFVELDAIFHTVKDTTDDAAASLYRKSIQDSQMMLIVRIKRLAGQEKGKKMIFEAVSQARKARSAKKSTRDTKPRVADAPVGEASKTASSLVSAGIQTPTPPSTPGSKTQAKAEEPSFDLGGLIPDNRVVVHELAINKEYQLPPDEFRAQKAAPMQPLYAHLRSTMHDPSDEQCFLAFMVLASIIRDKLQQLLKPGNSLYNFVGEILDPELAKQQFTLGNFSYEKFFTAMASLLPKLCAPARDDELKDLIQTKFAKGDITDRIEALHGFIDLMLCDYVNYLLMVASGSLIEGAAAYEARQFTADVENKGLGLTAAQATWKAARSKVLGEVQRKDPEGINHPRSRPAASRIYAQMLVDIFTQTTPLTAEQVPEMLRFDLKRIDEVSHSIRRIATAGAVLLQCKNILKRDVRSAWKMEASRIMTVLEAEHESIDTTVDGTMAALESGRSMPGATKSQLRALVTRVLVAGQKMGRDLEEPSEPVLRLLMTRLRGNILTRLTAQSASEKVKAANAAGEKLASLGLSEFVEKVRHISDLLDKVGTVDRAAHGPWWDAVATSVEQDEESTS
jgi:hypothetical protein